MTSGSEEAEETAESTVETENAADGDGESDRLLADHPVLLSVGIGVGTFVVEYVVVALFFLVGPSSVDLDGVRDTVVTYGHVVYNAHNVPTQAVVENATASGTANSNALYGATGGSVPPIVYFLIPVVALLVAGALVGRLRAAPPGTSVLKVSADNAGELALGYLVVGVVGTFVFVRTATVFEMTGSLSPNLAFTVGAFLVYPVLFGFLGSMGYLLWQRRQG